LVNETWVPIGESWLGHRPEPLIHERVWACPLTGRGPFRGAFDAQGRAVAYRQDEGYEERTTYESGRIVVRSDGHVKLETELDGEGRPVRTRYASGEAEHYRYQDDRLVEIDEAPGLLRTAVSGERWETGGRLRVEYDERGLCAIRGERELVWERRDEPWPGLLARGAAEIADGIEEIDGDVPDELERLLLREAALNDPGQPQRTVLNAVASALARRDWAGVIAPTDDFVAFIVEHDEGIAPKRESLRAVNPPKRVATWEARFPPSAYEY
jgi:hypothetical protein